MKKAAILAVFVLSVALLVSCAEKGMDELAGSWQRQNGNDTVTFSKDGKIQLVSGMSTINSWFKLDGKGNLQVDLGALGTATLKYALSKDELTLTDSKGKEVKYLRAKEEHKTAVKEEHKSAVQEEHKPAAKEEGKPAAEHGK